MRRGEIWWAELEPPAGRRPVLLLSRDDAYSARALVTIAPVTTRIRHIPSEVALGIAESLPQDCVANLDIITTIPKDCLWSHLTTLNAGKMKEVEAAIRFSLGIPLTT
jgi:mRNA interferase MazF